MVCFVLEKVDQNLKKKELIQRKFTVLEFVLYETILVGSID